MSISVYKLEKVNGENAQISYISDIDVFIIGSGDVSLAARSIYDLHLYEEQRFAFTLLIA